MANIELECRGFFDNNNSRERIMLKAELINEDNF